MKMTKVKTFVECTYKSAKNFQGSKKQQTFLFVMVQAKQYYSR